MKRILSFLLLSAALFSADRTSAQGGAAPSASAPSTYAEKVQRYIATYKDLAMAEQQRSGIPAAITLAQGILESGAGESELATEAANHFGIKCKTAWAGETYNHDDDAPDECFRKYASAEASYRDHTDYLKTAGRYAPCFEKSTTDYAAWAYQLKTCGYATSPTYAQRLIRIVEDYKLQQFTYAALNSQDPLRTTVAGEVVSEDDAPTRASSPVPTASEPMRIGEKPATSATPQLRTETSQLKAHSETPEEARSREALARRDRAAADAAASASQKPTVAADGTTMKDGRRGFYAMRGDVLLENAIRYRIRYAKLLEINGIPDEPLSADRFIYLEKATTSRLQHDVATLAGHDETARVAAAAERPRPMMADAAIIAEKPATEEMVASTSPTVPQREAVREPQFSPIEQPEIAAESAVRATEIPVISGDPTAQDAAATAADIPGRVPEVNSATEEKASERNQVREEPRVETASPAYTTVETQAQPDIQPATGAIEEPRAVFSEPVIADVAPRLEGMVTETQASIPAVDEAAPAISGTTSTNAVNIATEAAVEEGSEEETKAPAAVAEPEPRDEMSRLKARFDKAVYAPVKSSPKAAPVSAAPQPSAPVKAAPVAASSASTAKLYTVRKGDTAFGIAKKHGITVRQLQEWNGLSMEAGVPMGKKLKVQP